MIAQERNRNPDDGCRQPVEDVLRHEKLRALCVDPPVVIGRRASLAEAVERLKEPRSKGAVLVCGGGGHLSGILTERDYLDKVAGVGARLDRPVEDFMTPAPRTLSAEETVDKAIRWMTEGGYRHLPIVEHDGSLLGLVSTRDIIAYLAEFFPAEVFNLPPRLNRNQSFSTREGG